MYVRAAMFYTKIQGDQILGFFHVFIIPRNSSKITMKLDDALIQTGKKCFRGEVEAVRRCFSRLLTEGVQLNRDH